MVDADDLVQMTFHAAIRGWRKIDELSSDDQQRWLIRVLKNKAIDGWRKSRTIDLTPIVPESTPAHVDVCEYVELSIALQNCWVEIRQMPLVRQQVAFLIWSELWTTARVADELGITRSTVRSHLSEARKRLRSILGDHMPFIDEAKTYHGEEGSHDER